MSKKRTIAIFLIITSVWCALVVRLFYIQVWTDKSGAENFAIKSTYQNGPRGVIYDRNGNILAMSKKIIIPFLDAKVIDNAVALHNELKDLIKISYNEVENLVKSGRRYIPLNCELSYEDAEILKRRRIPGLGFQESMKRIYPEGELARNLLGICNENVKTGIELACDKYLSGKVIQVKKQRDGAGRSIPADFYIESLTKGADVFLTIDKNIQYIAESAASSVLKNTSAQKAVIVVQDVNSGELLAVASAENNPQTTIPAVSTVFEPGSTFKLFTFLAALSEGVAKEDELIFCENGKYKIYNHEINDHEKKGVLTLRQSFAFSSNIACAKIAQRMSGEQIKSFVRNFGFGCLSGINIPGEEKGLLPRKWEPLNIITVSYGQGICVTPVQMVNAYSAVANGGYLLEPQIVSSVRGKNGSLLFKSERRVIRKVADEKFVDIMKEMLSDVVKYGTGKSGAVDGYKIGGKTGTAQKIDAATGKYSTKDYVSSFCGILPIDNPMFCIFVMVDSPRIGEYWGGTVAAPVFSKVAAEIASYMRIEPSNEISQLAYKK